MGMHKNFACHLGPGFHSIQIFISLTLSAPKSSQNFLFKIYTFRRAEKHPSEQKCENREREQG